MPVSSEIWTQLSTTGSGGTAAPPPTRTLNLNDVRAFVDLNFGDFADPDGAECSAKLQAFLDYAGGYALAIKSSALDDQGLRNCVKVTIPRGNWFVKDQIVVPEWVELDMQGTLCRHSGGSLATNVYLPMIVYSVNAIASRVNVYCTDGTASNSGVVFGKSWSVTGVTSIVSGGSGYAVNDLIYLAQPSKLPYWAACLKVTSVSSGAVTGVTVEDGGAYSRRPRTGPTVSPAAITAVAPAVTQLVQPAAMPQGSTTRGGSPGPGTGATFNVTWTPDFSGTDIKGVYNYQTGPHLQADTLIGQVRVGGAGGGISTTYGAQFAVLLNLFNAEIDRICTGNGYYGIVGFCTDVRANCLNAVSARTGLMVQGNSFECPNVVLDTCFITYLEIMPNSHGVTLSGRTLWPEGNNGMEGGMGPINSGYAIIVGNDPDGTPPVQDSIKLDFAMSNSGSASQNGNAGAAALFLANIQNSHINIETSNQLTAISGTKKMKIHTGFGPGVDSTSVFVSGTIDGTSVAPVAYGATVTYGTPGAGGSGYAVGDIVRLTAGSNIVNATFQVTSVSSGAVTSVRPIGPGLYSTAPTTGSAVATATVTGSGSGLTMWLAVKAAPSSLPGGLFVRDGSAPGWVRDTGLYEMTGSGAPSGSTGLNKAARGSKYTNTATGDLYLNTGTAASPSWKKVTAV